MIFTQKELIELNKKTKPLKSLNSKSSDQKRNSNCKKKNLTLFIVKKWKLLKNNIRSLFKQIKRSKTLTSKIAPNSIHNFLKNFNHKKRGTNKKFLN